MNSDETFNFVERFNNLPTQDLNLKIENYLIKNNIPYFKNNFLNKKQKLAFGLSLNFFIINDNNVWDLNFNVKISYSRISNNPIKFKDFLSIFKNRGLDPHMFLKQILAIGNEK